MCSAEKQELKAKPSEITFLCTGPCIQVSRFLETFKITTPVQRRRPEKTHDNMSMESFDSLKREATKLERQLEEKVSRYQQVNLTRKIFLQLSIG